MKKYCQPFCFSLLALFSFASSACHGAGPQKTEKKVSVSSLTIFPVLLGDAPRKEVGEAVGLLLEQKGFKGSAIAEASFKPEKAENWDAIANAFAAYIAKNPIKTEHALYGEFLGSPKEGVACVRGVIVDKKGSVVWKDSQTPEDAAFKSAKPNCPMDCAVFLTDRLSPILVLASADSKDTGAMEKLWAEKSGTPGEKEFAAMKERLAVMVKAGNQATLLIYPARVGSKLDPESAETLALLLNEQKLCKASVATEELSFDIKGNSNEQKMLWDMARAFQVEVKKKAPTADYVLYADFILGAKGSEAHAVHFTICDKSGNWVIVDFQNNHHEDFNEIAPKSAKDCSRLVAKRLAGF